ncbi:hypothetical protein N9L68_00395 [bacterium]|nr:hypothetical protein [bacterium]
MLRLQAYSQNVQSVVDSTAGTWQVSQSSLLAVSSWEGRRLRHLAHLRKRKPEVWRQVHMKRAAERIRGCLGRARVKRCHERILEIVHALAGIVVGEVDEAGSPSAGPKLANYPSRSSFQRVSEEYDLRSYRRWGCLSGLRHAAAGRGVVAWEDVFIATYGDDWRTLAAQPTWVQSTQDCVTNICALWGLERSKWVLEQEERSL